MSIQFNTRVLNQTLHTTRISRQPTAGAAGKPNKALGALISVGGKAAAVSPEISTMVRRQAQAIGIKTNPKSSIFSSGGVYLEVQPAKPITSRSARRATVVGTVKGLNLPAMMDNIVHQKALSGAPDEATVIPGYTMRDYRAYRKASQAMDSEGAGLGQRARAKLVLEHVNKFEAALVRSANKVEMYYAPSEGLIISPDDVKAQSRSAATKDAVMPKPTSTASKRDEEPTKAERVCEMYVTNAASTEKKHDTGAPYLHNQVKVVASAANQNGDKVVDRRAVVTAKHEASMFQEVVPREIEIKTGLLKRKKMIDTKTFRENVFYSNNPQVATNEGLGTTTTKNSVDIFTRTIDNSRKEFGIPTGAIVSPPANPTLIIVGKSSGSCRYPDGEVLPAALVNDTSKTTTHMAAESIGLDGRVRRVYVKRIGK
jgi:hypothetical protein